MSEINKELPHNWVECNISDISDIIGGGTPNSNDDTNFGGEIAWITPADLSNYSDIYISRGRRNLSDKGLKTSSAKLMPKNSILFSSRAPIGYVAITSSEICTNQGFKSILPSQFYDSRFIYFYLKHIKKYAESAATGTTFKELSGSKFGSLKLKLAPLKEQIKISDKLESIFEVYIILQKKIDRTPEIIKQFKQNVLEQAVSGKLTKEWRQNNKYVKLNKDDLILNNKKLLKSKISDTWVAGNISDLFLVNPGHKGISIEDNLLVSFIPMASIEEENGIINTGVHRQYKEVKSGFTKFIEGDVLFAKITPCMENGKVGIATGLKSGLGCGTTELHVFREQIIGTNIILFYHFLLESFRQKAKSNFQGSSGHLRVPVTFFEDLKIDLPPKEEIEQIQKKVNELFKYVENIESHFIELKKVVQSLPNNVLEKAFSGELVKQDPEDESAEILLNKIKEEKHNKILTSVKSTKRSHKPNNNQEDLKQQLAKLKSLIRKKLIKIDKELSNQDLINIISNESSNQELIYNVMQELIKENAITQTYDKRKKEFYFKINESIKH